MAAGAASNEAIRAVDFAVEYAEFASKLTIDGLSPEVVAAAKTNLFDTLACATAGVSAAGVQEVLGLVVDWGGKPEASVWCSGVRAPAHHVAMVNGMMAHARDYDDTHDGAILHAGVSVIPAALAAAELRGDASGADLIAGIVVGLEFICRLGVATTIGIIESGFIYTSLFGHFAAAAAAARVMGFDADQTLNTLGVAYSQAAGTHQVTRDAALTKRLQPGFAAKTALLSVALTRVGIRGARNVFEGADGLFRTYLHGRYQAQTLREDLGRRFELLNLSYKPYPCCRFNHTAIDAALELRARLNGDVSQIRRIVAGVNLQSFEAVCTPREIRLRPTSIVQAQFSLPYTVACALAHGQAGLADFTESALLRPEIQRLAALVETRVDEDIERDWSRNVSPTLLRVETDMRAEDARVDLPRGNFGAPMDRDAFNRKMTDCLTFGGWRAPTGVAANLRQRVDVLETASRAAAVLAPLLETSEMI